ncbi:MAG TPA: hypothetical protein PKO06_08720 [Candidatus Ozemobacteraceae bacterium]|nr:hypothetical protein [Candidatus Ozemobacteraceae bacterium]
MRRPLDAVVRRLEKKAVRAVQEWNARYKKGQRVVVAVGDERFESMTSSRARISQTDPTQALIWLSGMSIAFDLSAITPIKCLPSRQK